MIYQISANCLIITVMLAWWLLNQPHSAADTHKQYVIKQYMFNKTGLTKD